MKKTALFFITLVALFGCASPAQQLKATEGSYIETGANRAEAINAVVAVLTGEGYAVDTVNEKFGLITAKPYTLSTKALMEKTGEAGSRFANTDHVIDFSANVSEGGVVKVRTTARIVGDISQSVDTFRTANLNDYLIKKIEAALNKK